jgi:hypothetical protein
VPRKGGSAVRLVASPLAGPTWANGLKGKSRAEGPDSRAEGPGEASQGVREMMYMVVKWDGCGYVILHYSHNFDDAIEQYNRFKGFHPECTMLADVRMVHLVDGMMKIRELQEHIKRQKENVEKKDS